jgi:cytochrome P450
MAQALPCLCRDPACALPGLPGQAGLLADSTLEFARDPLAFLETSCQRLKARVFLTRLALKQTVVIADYNVLTDFLSNNMDDFYNGLKDNFSDLFGHNIMFAKPEEAAELRSVLLPLFQSNDSTKHQKCLSDLLQDWKDGLDCSKPVNFYDEYKKLSLAYNMEVFMGVRRKENKLFFDEVSALGRTHWHGVISLPVSVSVPFWGGGGYRRAMDAKKKLLKIIEEKLESTDSAFFEDFKANNESVMDKKLLYNHMLLFSCALIPKGIASVLAMFFEMSPKWIHLLDGEGKLSEDDLECVLLEVLRMFPPFTGGLRVAVRDTQVGGHHLPAGTTVYYSLVAAMRDPQAFLHPEQFLPGRWRRVEERRRNLGFSTGPHDCIGRHFAMNCLRQVADFTLRNFSISAPNDCPPAVKHLPVLRPKQPHAFIVQKRT